MGARPGQRAFADRRPRVDGWTPQPRDDSPGRGLRALRPDRRCVPDYDATREVLAAPGVGDRSVGKTLRPARDRRPGRAPEPRPSGRAARPSVPRRLDRAAIPPGSATRRRSSSTRATTAYDRHRRRWWRSAAGRRSSARPRRRRGGRPGVAVVPLRPHARPVAGRGVPGGRGRRPAVVFDSVPSFGIEIAAEAPYAPRPDPPARLSRRPGHPPRHLAGMEPSSRRRARAASATPPAAPGARRRRAGAAEGLAGERRRGDRPRAQRTAIARRPPSRGAPRRRLRTRWPRRPHLCGGAIRPWSARIDLARAAGHRRGRHSSQASVRVARGEVRSVSAGADASSAARRRLETRGAQRARAARATRAGARRECDRHAPVGASARWIAREPVRRPAANASADAPVRVLADLVGEPRRRAPARARRTTARTARAYWIPSPPYGGSAKA